MTSSRSAIDRLRSPVLASALAYCAITAVLGRDVLTHLSTSVVHDVGDPLLTAALLHWNAWTLPLTHAWWQFPIFYPTPDALAFSEHLLGLSVVATPIEWLLRDPMIAANVTTLLTYPLTAMAVFLLVRRLSGSSLGAVVAGAAFAFSPYRVSQLPHVQMLAAFWGPVALLALHAYLESGRRRWLAAYGVAWFFQVTANGYSLFFFSALVALWIVWFVVLPRRWIPLRDIVITTLSAAVPLAPTLATYLAVYARNGFTRTAGDAQGFSADVTGLLCAPVDLSLWGWLRVGCRPEGEIFPGLVLVVLVVIGVAALLRQPLPAGSRVMGGLRVILGVAAVTSALAAISVVTLGPWRLQLGPLRASASSIDKPLLVLIVTAVLALVLSRHTIDAVRRSSTIGFYLFGALVMWVMALGPTVTLMGVQRAMPGPFGLLLLLPGGSGLRVPSRFWLMTTLCLSVVAGLTVSQLLARRRPRTAALWAVLLVAGVLSDGWAPIPAVPVPRHFPDEAALRGRTVLWLPVGQLDDFWPQYLAVVGGWHSVNGYSGWEPRYYEALRQGARFELDGLFDPFLARGDLFVVVGSDTPRLRDLVERQPGVQRIAERNGVLEYRLPRRPRPAGLSAPAETPVRIARVTSSCLSLSAPLAIDHNVDTRWVCGPQSGRESFEADLGAPFEVTSVRYALGRYIGDFPRDLVIETSVDGEMWEPARTGDVVAASIEGHLADPLLGTTTLRFPPRVARHVRLRQVGQDDRANWSIGELEIWGSAEVRQAGN